MTTEELFVQLLAEKVVEKLLERRKRALVVYTGAKLGSTRALEAMSRLRREGFRFQVLLSRGASRVLNQSDIRIALEPEELWVDQPDEPPEALAARYDTILVPTLTVNTAAHVSSCMADSPSSAVILGGLMRGKNVVCAIDGCCPDNEERAALGYRMAEPLKQRLRDNLEVLRAYGARLTTADHFYEKTMGTMKLGTERPEPVSVSRGVRPSTAGPSITSRVLSASQVRACQPGTELRVSAHTLITQLARDEARLRRVSIAVEEM